MIISVSLLSKKNSSESFLPLPSHFQNQYTNRHTTSDLELDSVRKKAIKSPGKAAS